ncbi:hypothetical protein ONV78_13180 [Hahella sp. CR1]|uniref:hypothetical protein n=1 Tax=Hahella sp. CR1 TaxID=2992807 RepID=UPI002440F571|nr:hypothetical protein [Hahella sp. CR1]MDG9668689.1 hypothetical protein [Hahella sp. CR1]
MNAGRKGQLSFEELKDYLESKGELELINYVQSTGERLALNKETFYTAGLTPSRRYQVACVFMLLGEYSVAIEICRHVKGESGLSEIWKYWIQVLMKYKQH